MTTLDEEWLGGDGRPVEERLAACSKYPYAQHYPSRELVDEAAGEIRALRLLVKNQSKRIDDLEMELDNAYGEGEQS
jgi:hypothetical protein